MFTFRFRLLISIAMIVSLFVAQFASVPHVHVGTLADQSFEHGGRAHIHVGQNNKSNHGHTHAHGHTHKHSAKCTIKSKTRHASLAIAADHDQDAIFLVQSPIAISVRAAYQVEQNQRIVTQPVLAFLAHQNQLVGDCDCWRLPDKLRRCPIYLLTMSIRC